MKGLNHTSVFVIVAWTYLSSSTSTVASAAVCVDMGNDIVSVECDRDKPEAANRDESGT